MPDYWHGIHQQLMLPAAKPMTVWNTRTRRYCPICLKADGIWRAQWELSLVTSCSTHKVQLTQHCSVCAQELTWKCNDVLSCGVCGESITDADTAEDDLQRVWLSDQLSQRLIVTTSADVSALNSLCLSDLHHLAVTLGARQSEAGQTKPLKVKDSNGLGTAQRVAHAAASLLIDWPFNFRRYLRDRLSETGSKDWSLPHKLGPIYSDVYKRLSRSCYDFVRQELELVIKTDWRGPITLRNRRLSPGSKGEHDWAPIKEMSRRHDIPEALIRRLVRTGEVRSEIKECPSGKTQTLIYEDSLARRVEQLRTIVNLEQLALLWGLPEERVRQFADAGLLKFVAGRPQPGETWWFTAENIGALGRIGTTLPAYERQLKEQSSLYWILRYQIVPAEAAPIILEKVRSGALAASGRLGPAEMIGSWLFSDRAIAMLKAELQPKHHLSVSEAAKLLRIKEQVAYRLVSLKLLNSDVAHTNAGPVFHIHENAIAAFKKTYCFGSELAEEIGCSTRWLPTKLRSQGIEPVAGPGVNGAECRQYVWLRTADLQAYLSDGYDVEIEDEQ